MRFALFITYSVTVRKVVELVGRIRKDKFRF